eukprot:m.488074 g.488074  ORF g.488074 m.488074 type:complete len:425 (-) comp21762_c0_seq1:234-1508(-)
MSSTTQKRIAAAGKAKGKNSGDKQAQSSLVTKEYKRLKELSNFGKTDATSNKQVHVCLGAVPNYLRKCNEGDIVQPKSGKARYLLQFPAAFTASDLSQRATVGRLAKLDTYTPVLYLDFQDYGQAKFHGYRQYIKSNIVAFECKSSGLNVIQQFDHLIVFTELVWVGTREENPNEVPLPFPTAIVERSMIEKGSHRETVSSVKFTTSDKFIPTSSAKFTSTISGHDSETSPASITGNPPESTSTSSRSRSSSRVAKPISYAIRGSSEEEESDSDEDSGSSMASIRKRSSEKNRGSPPVLDIFDDDDDAREDSDDMHVLPSELKPKAAPTQKQSNSGRKSSIIKPASSVTSVSCGTARSEEGKSKKVWSPQIKKRKRKGGHSGSTPASLLLFGDDVANIDDGKKRKTDHVTPKRTLEAFGFEVNS